MHICGFHIDGFGIFHNQGVQDVPNGLVVFNGENESGKTTLMEFIRTVLFGFPRRGSRNDYPPLRGGNHGGRLQVMMEDGRRFTIERTRRHMALVEDGETTEQVEPSERVLGRLDRQTFERVFAIGLDELQGLDVLSQDSVRSRLFAASAGLGAASVSGIMQALDTELNVLLSQRGRRQRINQIVKRLREVELQISELQGQAGEYAECQRARAELEEQIEEAQSEVEHVRQRLRRIEQLTRARESWVRLSALREKEASLEFAKDFPPDGLERFEKLRREIEGICQDKEAKGDEAARLERQLSEVTVDVAVIQHRQAIEALVGEREKLASALSDLPIVKSRMQEAEEEYKRRLSELGMDWNSERLAQVDTSVQMRQHVQELGRQLDTAERRYEQAQGNLERLEEAEREAAPVAEEAQQRFEELSTPPITDLQQLQRKQEAVRMVRTVLHKRDIVNIQLEAKRAIQQDLGEQLGSLKRRLETDSKILPSWAPIISLMAGVALAALVAIQRSYISALIMFLVGVGLGTLFYILRRRLLQIERDEQQVEYRLRTVTDEVKTFEQQLEAIDGDTGQLAYEAGVEQPGDVMQLEQLAGELECAAEQLREWRQRKREREEAETKWYNIQERLGQAKKETEGMRQGLQDLQNNWQRWLADRGFSDTIRPEGFEAILQAVERARDAEQNLQEIRQRGEQMEAYIAKARTKIYNLLDACRRTPLADDIGVEDLDALRHDFETARDAQRRQQGLKDKLEIIQLELERLDTQLNQMQSELGKLFQHAGAADEEEFRRIADSYRSWHECIRQIEAEKIALRTIAGTPEAQEALETELSEMGPLQLQDEKERLQARLEEVTKAVSEMDRKVGGLNRRFAELAQDEKLGELLLEQSGLQEQLSDATKRWATLVVCRHLLEQARAIYERERQPRVVQEAGKFLDTMTGARYRLVSPVGGGSIQLEDTGLRRKGETTWSSGLADQVYLTIRLGLAHEFGRHAESLPVILDDVLVRFDPVRQLGAAKVILDFAHEQQVLLFSCHPEFERLIEQAREDSQFRGVVVAYYAISDGIITKSSFLGGR